MNARNKGTYKIRRCSSSWDQLQASRPRSEQAVIDKMDGGDKYKLLCAKRPTATYQ